MRGFADFFFLFDPENAHFDRSLLSSVCSPLPNSRLLLVSFKWEVGGERDPHASSTGSTYGRDSRALVWPADPGPDDRDGTFNALSRRAIWRLLVKHYLWCNGRIAPEWVARACITCVSPLAVRGSPLPREVQTDSGAPLLTVRVEGVS